MDKTEKIFESAVKAEKEKQEEIVAVLSDGTVFSANSWTEFAERVRAYREGR
jgi:hypothetical protein